MKIENYTLTKEKDKLIINAMTKVTKPLPAEYSFQHCSVVCNFEELTVEKILETANEWDLISFIGKVQHVSEITIVGERKIKLAEVESGARKGV